MKFHPNCNYVFTGSSDKSIRMWDIHKGNCVRLFTGHLRGITSLAVSSNGRLLASGGKISTILIMFLFIVIDMSGSIKIWDIAEGKLFKTFSGDSTSASKYASIYALSFCQDAKILASCASDNTVKIWDVQKPASLVNVQASEEPVATFHTKQTPLMTARFTPRNVLSVIGAFATE